MNEKVQRTWGTYEVILVDDTYKVKRVVVNPKASLSLQRHYHRSEHWIVTKGTLRVTRGAESYLVKEDGMVYIPLGTSHRLENPGNIPAELIEVQFGSYLSEEDIERYDNSPDLQSLAGDGT